MLTRDKENLEVLENFVIDKNLPKHKVKESSRLNFDSGNSFAVTSGNVIGSWGEDGDNDSPIGVTASFKKLAWYESLYQFFSRKKKQEPVKISIIEFFQKIKDSVSSESFDEKKYNKRVNGYIKTLENAKKAGQVSFIETISDQLNAVKYENLLYAAGNVTTITEQQIITFYKEATKGVRLDWIKNFNRVIPDIIIDKKVKLDKLKVFDNYVVMHYDPDKKSFKETEAEKAARKDPILFGLIKGVDRLYFIADWTDEYCDLTLETLINKFGNKVIKSNNISVKF